MLNTKEIIFYLKEFQVFNEYVRTVNSKMFICTFSIFTIFSVMYVYLYYICIIVYLLLCSHI